MTLNENLAGKIVELLKSAQDGAKNALHAFQTGDISTFARIMSEMQNAILSVQESLAPFSQVLSMSQCFNIITNIQNSIINMVDRISGADSRRAEIILEFEIVPLLAELKEDIYFFCLIYPDKDRMGRYYKEEFAKNHQNEYIRDGKAHFDVSLVVVAWNKLDYTRQCIESLLKYTDVVGLNCEIITINHGSEDGTKEYFESLPHEKKINFKKNMCTIASSYLLRIVEGKYCVSINNDVILTENWLENLIKCVRADDRTAIACPVTSNISNHQSIPVSYKNFEEMHKFAASYNISNPDLWDERVKLCPPVAIMNMDILNMTGFSDRYFVHMEFGDDDTGALFRRNGYKQILLCDTFCHHFGSITLGESQRINNTLEKSRKLFLDKFGFDPWNHGFCFDIEVINALDCKLQGGVKILGIDAGIGSTPLQIKNELRHNGNREALLYSFTTEKLFEPDLKPYSDYFTLDAIENIEACYEEIQFDFIYIGKMLEEYDCFESLMRSLKKMLKKNGQMIFKINNPYNVCAIYELSGFRMPGGEKRIQRLDPFWLHAYLGNLYAECRITANGNEIPAQLADFYKYLLKSSNGFANSEIFLKASTFHFTLKG